MPTVSEVIPQLEFLPRATEPFRQLLVHRPGIHRPAYEGAAAMYSIFYIIGVIVVVLAILSLVGLA